MPDDPTTPARPGGEDAVEALAEHLATEHDYADNMRPGYQWPLHANDDGYRGGGYVRLIPTDVREHRRDDAKRILAFLATLRPQPDARAAALTEDEVVRIENDKSHVSNQVVDTIIERIVRSDEISLRAIMGQEVRALLTRTGYDQVALLALRALASAPPPGQVADGCAARDERQRTVADWVVRCWGAEVLASHAERGGRLLEEALEMAQAAGLPQAKAERILAYVYGRPPGDPSQEAGGVGVTLLALCASLGLSAEACEAAEVARVLAKPVDHFRRRHAEKEAAGVMVTQQAPPAAEARP